MTPPLEVEIITQRLPAAEAPPHQRRAWERALRRLLAEPVTTDEAADGWAADDQTLPDRAA